MTKRLHFSNLGWMNDLSSNSKIIVVGTSGSGKTTLAKRLATMFRLVDIELDALFWEKDWTGAAAEVFQERVTNKMKAGSGWVVHGNYSKTRHLYWKQATHLIWLDYSFTLVFWRVLSRSIKRIIRDELLWNGNRETFRRTFFSKESIILWMIKTYSLKKKQYEELIKLPETSHMHVLRFSCPKELDRFLGI